MQVEGFRTDNLLNTCKNIFSDNGLPSKIGLDVGTDFGSEKFTNLCKQPNLHHLVLSLCNDQSNGQMKIMDKIFKRTMNIWCRFLILLIKS